jgi:hypothetical protein
LAGLLLPGVASLHDLSDAAVKNLTAAILRRSEFDGATEKLPAWIHWLQGFLRFLEKFHALYHSSPRLYWFLLIMLFIATATLIVYIVRSLRLVMTLAEPSPPQFSSTCVWPDPLAEANRLAAAGSYLDAAHYLMIASFDLLARHSIIELRPDRPNRWIRDALQNSRLVRSLADEINSLVVHTEYLWFGGRLNDPEIYSQWLSAFERLSETAK